MVHKLFYSNLKDLEKLKEEGEPKVADVVVRSEAVLPNTAAPGKDIIARDIEAMQTDWSAFIILLVEVSCSRLPQITLPTTITTDVLPSFGHLMNNWLIDYLHYIY